MNGDKNNVGAKPTWTEPMNDLRLGAARKRLAESQGQEDAIDGVREIVANLLGCEEIGLFQPPVRERRGVRLEGLDQGVPGHDGHPIFPLDGLHPLDPGRSPSRPHPILASFSDTSTK